LAQYLERKAMFAEGARRVVGRPTYTHDDLVRADGTLYTEKEVMPDDDYSLAGRVLPIIPEGDRGGTPW
jgi:hypothetical protein